MALPPQFLDELRARLPASEVIGRAIRLARRGREHVGLCPFHNEKTPSFTVNDDKAFFHCFGCGAHGDIIGFVMQHDGLPFPEAVERLAGEAGLSVPKPTPEARARAAREASLLEVLDKAAEWFARALARDDGAAARAYLDSRGVDAPAQARFRLGYAPGRGRALASLLAGEGIDEALALDAGLIRRAERAGESFDFFRNRLMFPIADGRGRVIGFGGRVLGDGQPKYLNSPEGPVFRKGRTLYNLAGARVPAREAGTVIVAEGYMDVIALSAAGFDNAVAPLGTALTEDQLAALWRLAPEPVLCLDGDTAGRRAAARAAARALPLLGPGRSLRFALLPEGEDPDSLVRRQGPAAVAGCLERAWPLVEVIWRQAAAGAADTPERRAGVRKRLDELAAEIADRDVRDQYRAEFRRRFEAAFGAPRAGRKAERGHHVLRPHSAYHGHSAKIAGPAEGEQRERLMLVTLLNHPALIAEVIEELATLSFAAGDCEVLRAALIAAAEGDAQSEHERLDGYLRAHGLGEAAARMCRRSGFATAPVTESFARPGAHEAEALRGFRHLAARHRRALLEAEIAAAVAALAQQMTDEALAHLAALQHQLESLDRGHGEASPGRAEAGLASPPPGTT